MNEIPAARCNRTITVAAMLMAGFLSGCGSGHSVKSPGGGKVTVSGEATEDQARHVLKTVLDAWVFGDDEAKLKREHPEIRFVQFSSDRLVKYELGAGRKSGRLHEFAVAMFLKDKGGKETKETRIYLVSKKSPPMSEDEKTSPSLKRAREQEAKLFGDADWHIVQKAAR